MNTRQNDTDGNLLAIAHGNHGADVEVNIDRVIRTGNLDLFARFVDQLDLRTHHDLAATRLGRDDDQRGQARDFIQLLGNRHAFFDVLEAHQSGVFGHDRTRQRIPVGQTLTSLDDIAIAYGNGGAVLNLVTFALAAVVVKNDDVA